MAKLSIKEKIDLLFKVFLKQETINKNQFLQFKSKVFSLRGNDTLLIKYTNLCLRLIDLHFKDGVYIGTKSFEELSNVNLIITNEPLKFRIKPKNNPRYKKSQSDSPYKNTNEAKAKSYKHKVNAIQNNTKKTISNLKNKSKILSKQGVNYLLVDDGNSLRRVYIPPKSKNKLSNFDAILLKVRREFINTPHTIYMLADSLNYTVEYIIETLRNKGFQESTLTEDTILNNKHILSIAEQIYYRKKYILEQESEIVSKIPKTTPNYFKLIYNSPGSKR